MVDLEISHAQDIQNPLASSAPASRIPQEGQDRETGPRDSKARRRRQESAPAQTAPVDLEMEVKHLNELLGSATNFLFAINRTTDGIHIEVVQKSTNEVLRTIPPSELGALAGKLSCGGILVDHMF